MNERPSFSTIRYRAARASRQIVVAAILAGLILPLGPVSLFSALAVWPAPVLVNPSNGTTTTVANYPPAAVPHFEWQPVPGVPSTATYRIQIDNEIGFSPPIQYDVTTPNTRYIPTSNNALADGTWYWRVRVDSPIPVGDWSEIRQFTKSWGDAANAPALLSPANGATVEFFEDPIFSWTPVTGAADYTLKIDNDINCPSPVQTYTTLTTHYNLSTRLINGTYYWCVVPRDAAGRDGQVSESRQVIVSYSQTPQLLEPADGAQPVYTPRFRWTAVKGASAYKLYYSTDNTFLTNVVVNTVNQTSFTQASSLPNDVNYYWRVSAVYGSGAEGPFSVVRQFQKRWYHQPINLTPRNN